MQDFAGGRPDLAAIKEPHEVNFEHMHQDLAPGGCPAERVNSVEAVAQHTGGAASIGALNDP